MDGDKRTLLGHSSTQPAPKDSIASALGDMTPPPTDKQSLQDELVGTTLQDRYIIEKKLGEGGMGSVYLARHATLDKLVALKVMHAEFARKQDLVERFLQEAKSASRIRHENVIDITDFGKTPDGVVYFAMEYLEGHDLQRELGSRVARGESMPWPRSRDIFLQVCSALHAAHARGVVHRDLKPENIFLMNYEGRDFVKLLDFGIAKLTEVGDDERKLTRTGMLFGTPEYMSPEQARGEKADQRVDVYAMGCILYQLVAGRVPFSAASFMAVLTAHLSQEPPPLGASVGIVKAPDGIEDVIRKAMAKARDDRFASIEELARAVAALEDMEITMSTGSRGRASSVSDVLTPPPRTFAPRVSSPRIKQKSNVARILVAVALLGAAAAGAFVYFRKDEAPTPAATVTPPPAPAVENNPAVQPAGDPTPTPVADPNPPTGEPVAQPAGDPTPVPVAEPSPPVAQPGTQPGQRPNTRRPDRAPVPPDQPQQPTQEPPTQPLTDPTIKSPFAN